MGRLAIHCEPRIEWQGQRAQQFLNGLKVLGFDAYITTNRQRETDIAILLGTSCWRSVEAFGDYLLVDRASIGDPDCVSLVWNGHGRRGDHKVPDLSNGHVRTLPEVMVHPWNGHGDRVVLCGQTETYSPHYRQPEDWYTTVEATHFRKHPVGANLTGLPLAVDWTDVGQVVTLNSSVGVESVLNGIPTVTMDEGSMAWDVTAHQQDRLETPNRDAWLAWLAWTQWNWLEIEAGEPIRHLFEEL